MEAAREQQCPLVKKKLQCGRKRGVNFLELKASPLQTVLSNKVMSLCQPRACKHLDTRRTVSTLPHLRQPSCVTLDQLLELAAPENVREVHTARDDLMLWKTWPQQINPERPPPPAKPGRSVRCFALS